MIRKMVLFGSLLFVGLTAGAAYVIWFDYNPNAMSATFYAETMQHAIRVLTIPLPTIVVLGLLFTVTASLQARSDQAQFILLTAASLCVLAVALITRFGNIPINNQILTWNIVSPPANWAELAEKWWQFQTARVVCQTAALGLVSSAVLLRMSVKGSRPAQGRDNGGPRSGKLSVAALGRQLPFWGLQPGWGEGCNGRIKVVTREPHYCPRSALGFLTICTTSETICSTGHRIEP